MIGIYIHIPFCAAKCNYCDFNSHIYKSGEREEYVNALCKEIKEYRADGCKVNSIFFGGGTPTVLEISQLISILDTVRNTFEIADDCEITTECNPATVDREGFEKLRMVGFNRVSIGIQSANNECLKTLGRIHTFEQGAECVAAARATGFDNISVDLMFGIPDQDMDEWKCTLEKVTELKTEHISCYALKVEENTPFARMKLNIADEDESFEMYDFCANFLDKKGYKRYEISNFAKCGYESRHNKKYWRCEDFVGFGVGAYSCVDGKRFSNIISTARYISNVNNGISTADDVITLSKDDMMSEFVYLGLRMDEGISISEFEERFSTDIFDKFGNELEKNIKRGTIIKEGDKLKIAPEFVYVSNSVLVDFV